MSQPQLRKELCDKQPFYKHTTIPKGVGALQYQGYVELKNSLVVLTPSGEEYFCREIITRPDLQYLVTDSKEFSGTFATLMAG